MNLINQLKERNHNKLYHLELNNATHSDIPINNKEDSDTYLHFVNELYNQYIV